MLEPNHNNKSFGTQKVLKDFSFTVEPNTITALSGPSVVERLPY